MSRKTELLNLYNGYKARFESERRKVDEVAGSTQYTQEGKAEQLNKIIAEFTPIAQTYRDQALSSINGGLQALQAKRTQGSAKRLADVGYQTGLANVMKLLEAGAYSQPEDIQELVGVYKDDSAALRMIGNALSNSDDVALKALAAQIPADHYEQNKALLTRLQDSVREYFQPESLTKAPSLESPGAALSVAGMSDFVMNRLNDDLELTQ